MSTLTMARHAMDARDKQARRGAILSAARRLFLDGDGGLPSAARIAAAAGLAKGTLYLYFRTKEEIFMALSADGWLTLLADVRVPFERPTGGPSAAAGTFLDRYVGYLRDHPELMRLDSLEYAVLERNIDPEQLRDFRRTFSDRLGELGVLVERCLALPAGRGLRLLSRTSALTRGLWQSLDCPECLPGVPSPPSATTFTAELSGLLAEYWRGAVRHLFPSVLAGSVEPY